MFPFLTDLCGVEKAIAIVSEQVLIILIKSSFLAKYRHGFGINIILTLFKENSIFSDQR